MSRTFSSLIVVRFHLVLLHFQCISSTPVWLSFVYDVWDFYTVLKTSYTTEAFLNANRMNSTTTQHPNIKSFDITCNGITKLLKQLNQFVSQEWPFRNPCCSGYRILFSSLCFMILLANICSIVLQQTDGTYKKANKQISSYWTLLRLLTKSTIVYSYTNCSIMVS
jgi:hypothetical protein